jgi:hypothetical protein
MESHFGQVNRFNSIHHAKGLFDDASPISGVARNGVEVYEKEKV